MSELILVKNEALHAINNLKKWMQPLHVERNLVNPFSENIFILLLGLFMIYTTFLEGTFHLVDTKKCIVPSMLKQIKS